MATFTASTKVDMAGLNGPSNVDVLMAIAKDQSTYENQNFSGFNAWTDDLFPTKLVVDGAFVMSGNTILSGTVHDIEAVPVPGAGPAFTISGLNFDWGSLVSYLQMGNPGGNANFAMGAMLGGDDTVIGSDFNDTLIGWGGNDTIYGGGGDDTLIGQEGYDTLYGGAGNDVLYGGHIVYGGGDNDTIDGTGENDVVHAGAGDDEAAGWSGNDLIYGETGADILKGYNDNDTLFGGAGNDQLYGGDGNDKLGGGSGLDWLDGGPGTDSVDYAAATGSVAVTLDGATWSAVKIGGVLADYVKNIEYVSGGAYADTLIGDNVNNHLHGKGGADVIKGQGGSDLIAGGGGNDALYGGAAGDLISGGVGNDLLSGGAGPDAFRFDTALNSATNVDTITDFDVAQDWIDLSSAVFSALSAADNFFKGYFAIGAAKDADDHIIYKANTGDLLYDADGNGGGAAVLFAHIGAGLALTVDNFLVV